MAPQGPGSERTRRPRLQDIAEEAGVGIATVERVLNGRANVLPRTAQRVIIAARKLGCEAAQSLVIGDTPYDVEAAAGCGVSSVAVRTGGFSRDALRKAGAIAVLDDVAMLADWSEGSRALTAGAWKTATIAAS